jgi:hypothetical protein
MRQGNSGRAAVGALSAAIAIISAAALVAAIPDDYKGKPFKDKAQVIPGKVIIPNYDVGGEGVAYHDVDKANHGSGELNRGPGELDNFRKDEGVDTSYTKQAFDKSVEGKVEPLGVLYVGWTSPGEWLKYTVDVQEAGTYVVNAHMSSNNKDAEISLSFNGEDKTGPIVVASTGNWHTWKVYNKLAEVKLDKGVQVMTLKFVKEGNHNVDYIEFVKAGSDEKKSEEKKAEAK